MTGGNVKEAQLVRPRRVIEARLLHRIARIGEIDEIDAFHHAPIGDVQAGNDRSEEHTSELQSLMRISYAVFCLKKKNIDNTYTHNVIRLHKARQEPTIESHHTHDHTQQ